jgi:hypothetical protein
MTELATPPVEREQDVKRINHWIGGRTVEGTSGRSGPVYNPARGIQTGALDFATVEEVDQAVHRGGRPGRAVGEGGISGVADDVVVEADGDLLRGARARRRAPRGISRGS